MFGGRYWGGRYFGARYWGKTGLTVPGYFWGGNYWGARYFGQRYWGKADLSIPFEITATNTVAVTGVVTLGGGNLVFGSDWELTQVTGILVSGSVGLTGGSLSFDNEEWVLTPPIPLGEITGTVTVGGTFVIGAPAAGYGGYWGRRYWSGRYFAPRYWGAPEAFEITQVTGIGLSGVIGVAGGITTAIGFSPTNTIGLSGTVAVSTGGISIAVPDVDTGKPHKPKSDGYDQEAENRQTIMAALVVLASIGALD